MLCGDSEKMAYTRPRAGLGLYLLLYPHRPVDPDRQNR